MDATNTCGEESDTDFCVQTGYSNRKSCDVCKFVKQFLIKFIISYFYFHFIKYIFFLFSKFFPEPAITVQCS